MTDNHIIFCRIIRTPLAPVPPVAVLPPAKLRHGFPPFISLFVGRCRTVDSVSFLQVSSQFAAGFAFSAGSIATHTALILRAPGLTDIGTQGF